VHQGVVVLTVSLPYGALATPEWLTRPEVGAFGLQSAPAMMITKYSSALSATFGREDRVGKLCGRDPDAFHAQSSSWDTSTYTKFQYCCRVSTSQPNQRANLAKALFLT
jgi:hypothetical protein